LTCIILLWLCNDRVLSYIAVVGESYVAFPRNKPRKFKSLTSRLLSLSNRGSKISSIMTSGSVPFKSWASPRSKTGDSGEGVNACHGNSFHKENYLLHMCHHRLRDMASMTAVR
jgi:hypothetical protein